MPNRNDLARNPRLRSEHAPKIRSRRYSAVPRVAVVALIALDGVYIWSHSQPGLTARGVDPLQVLIFSDMDCLIFALAGP